MKKSMMPLLLGGGALGLIMLMPKKSHAAPTIGPSTQVPEDVFSEKVPETPAADPLAGVITAGAGAGTAGALVAGAAALWAITTAQAAQRKAELDALFADRTTTLTGAEATNVIFDQLPFLFSFRF